MSSLADYPTYQLQIHVKKSVTVQVGKLGCFEFAAGLYQYTGSARKNIHARVHRHLQKNKKLRWHIDYLLTHPDVDVIDVIYSELPECIINQQGDGEIKVKGFGSSDCKRGCGSHLKYLGAL